jgi:hypothetical protein
VGTSGIISTFAGNGGGTCVNAGTPSAATNSAVCQPRDVKGDSLGNIYISDTCGIRRVDRSGIISLLLAQSPIAIWVDIYGRIVYPSGGRVYALVDLSPTSQPSGQPTTMPTLHLRSLDNVFMQLVAGKSLPGYTGDSVQATSTDIRTLFIWGDTNRNIYLPDNVNCRIRKIDTAGIITTFGGTGTEGHSGAKGAIGSVSFHSPFSIIGDAGGMLLYISDQWYIWKYIFSTNNVSVHAQSPGISGGFSGDDGPATSARLNGPKGIWLTTADVLYVADANNHRVRKVSSDIITTVAGSGCTDPCTGNGFSGDNGPATSARLNYPQGVYMDTSGKLFIADSTNNRIRLVDTNSIITTFAGTGDTAFNGDNIPMSSANINKPVNLKGDSLGNIYIAVNRHCAIRMVDPRGIISTLFGTPSSCGFSPGVSSRTTMINEPVGIWLDSLSNIYFSDTNSIHRSFAVSSPTSQPSGQPTRLPTAQPTRQPSSRPSKQPTSQPTNQPSSKPSQQPTLQPTSRPSKLSGSFRNFTYTGSLQTLIVPTDVNLMYVQVAGAEGVINRACEGASPPLICKGALVRSRFFVTPGTLLYIYVGGQQGWNGGGLARAGSGSGSCCGGGAAGNGGDASDIRIGGTNVTNRVIVAGGGGGGVNTVNCALWGWGGVAGQIGQDGSYQGSPGLGATSSAGGAPGSLNCASGVTPGVLGKGGKGDVNSAGGGGGYYGGIIPLIFCRTCNYIILCFTFCYC